jgi:hypothetical protein
MIVQASGFGHLSLHAISAAVHDSVTREWDVGIAARGLRMRQIGGPVAESSDEYFRG